MFVAPVLGAVLGLLGCVDPHARPVPPRVVIQLPDSLTVRSPGTLPHAVYAFDPNGIQLVRVLVQASDSLLRIDSTLAPPDTSEVTESYDWAVPAGLASGTSIRILVIATDFLGLVTEDSIRVTVQ